MVSKAQGRDLGDLQFVAGQSEAQVATWACNLHLKCVCAGSRGGSLVGLWNLMLSPSG